MANVDELIEGINRTHPLTLEMLEQIVREDEKQRYSFNEEKTLIRANQGHSIPVDVELKKVTPPDVLYHGTGEKSVVSIDVQGLIPMSRLYIHLSGDYSTARKVGQRHGKPVIYRVLSGMMSEEGIPFYRSIIDIKIIHSSYDCPLMWAYLIGGNERSGAGFTVWTAGRAKSERIAV